MKTGRDIAEIIFDKFRVLNCKDGQGFFYRSLFSTIQNLNPKEKEIWNAVYCGLQALDYIVVDSDGKFLRLTRKGYDYIYDDIEIKRLSKIPWIIPTYLDTNWNKAYNSLWSVIGQEGGEYYIKGSDFFNEVKSLNDEIAPNYSKYIEERRNNKLSTSRVDFYKDLINQLEEDKRYKLYVKIQSMLELKKDIANNKDDEKIEDSIFEDKPIDETKEEDVSTELENHPIVFISYSWDNDTHKDWVRTLAENLRSNGIDVILDQWELHGGKIMTDFMATSVKRADRVICVITPNYYKKAEGLEGGVGCEYSIITLKIAKDLRTDKFIPLLREGDEIPTYLDNRFRYEIIKDSDYEEVYKNLVRDIYGEPKAKKTKIRSKTRF